MSETSSIWHPLQKALAAAIVLAGHLAIMVVMMLAIWAAEWVFTGLFGDHQPMVFDLFPLKYLFQAPEIGTMAVFTIWGIIEAHRTMKG